MPVLEVGSRSFRDIDSYNCAKRDQIKIEELRSRYDMTALESVNSLIDEIQRGYFKFESLLGDDFLEELEDISKQLSEETSLKSNTAKKDKLKGREKSNNKKQTLRSNGIKSDTKNSSLDNTTVDDLLKYEINKHLKNNERKRRIYIAFLSLVAVVCIGYLSFYYYMYFKNEGEYNQLAALVDDNKELPVDDSYTINLTKEDNSDLPILDKYEKLYQKNKKIVGWLKIEGTNIDYPVMQTVNNEYYLDHNYNQEYDKNGSIFLDKDCDIVHPNDNMIIYGHHMKSGKMFGSLNLYSKEDYCKEHPDIIFDTIYEEGTYKIMYVFRSKIYSEEEIVFKYYKFIDATSENEFDSNMEEMAKLSLYDTGVKAKYGDRLITLSTCDYNESNGRFVIVAKKIK